MLRRLRENGPVVLVPLAWTFVAAAHLGAVADRTLLIAHLVMDVVLVAFVALSWSEMTEGVLLAWRRVILAGVGLTTAGTVGIVRDVWAGMAVAVLGWMVAPAAALVYTGLLVDRSPTVYRLGGALSAVGAGAYAVSLATGATSAQLLGLALAGIGQTAGIVVAVRDY